MKSMNMISTIGRRPVIAAPTAAPTKPISLIGVSMHAVGAEALVQALRDGEDAAARADVDADQDDALVGFQRVGDASVERVHVARRRRQSPIDMRVGLLEGGGRGARARPRRPRRPPPAPRRGAPAGAPRWRAGADEAARRRRRAGRGRASRPPRRRACRAGRRPRSGRASGRSRPRAGPAPRRRGSGGRRRRPREDRLDVVAVDALGRRRRRPRRARRRAGTRVIRAAVGELRVDVVLAQEDHRQVPDRGEVERLVERALVDGALAEERDGDAALPRHLLGQRRRRPRAACSPPTIAFAPRMPTRGSAMCIEPPLPRHRPVASRTARPSSASTSAPLARHVAVAAVGGRRGSRRRASAAQTPAATASWPSEVCTKPGISPSRYSSATRVSKARISAMRSKARWSSGRRVVRLSTYQGLAQIGAGPVLQSDSMTSSTPVLLPAAGAGGDRGDGSTGARGGGRSVAEGPAAGRARDRQGGHRRRRAGATAWRRDRRRARRHRAGRRGAAPSRRRGRRCGWPPARRTAAAPGGPRPPRRDSRAAHAGRAAAGRAARRPARRGGGRQLGVDPLDRRHRPARADHAVRRRAARPPTARRRPRPRPSGATGRRPRPRRGPRRADRHAAGDRAAHDREPADPAVPPRPRLDATHLLAQKERAGRGRVGVNDLLVQAIAETAVRHPLLAAAFVAGRTAAACVQRDAIDVGLAVATDRGLLVPVIRGAHEQGLAGIAAERPRLIDAARARAARAGGHGRRRRSRSRASRRCGVDRFTAMVNPGESTIVAVGRTVEKLVPRGRTHLRRADAHHHAELRPPRGRRRRRRRRAGRARGAARRGHGMAAVSGRVLVLGAASGIGHACADALHEAGWHVLGGDMAEIEPGGVVAESAVFDVRDLEAVEAGLARAAGPFDALVNAAGPARVAPIPEITPKGWSLLIDVNLTGAFNVLQRRRAAHHRRRLDRDHLLGRLAAAGPRPRALLRVEGRRRGAVALRRARARAARHPLQRRRARRRAHAADGAVSRPPARSSRRVHRRRPR